jgi:hypothetical protein
MLCLLCANNLDCFIRDQVELYARSLNTEVAVVQCEAFESAVSQIVEDIPDEELAELIGEALR